MWVFTKDGFFSAVFDKYCHSDELMVRARCKEDLCLLSKKLKGYCDESEIVELGQADYQFRMKIPKQSWAEYLSNSALDIDYANFKDHTLPAGDDLRKDIYYQVWTALYRWQSLLSST